MFLQVKIVLENKLTVFDIIEKRLSYIPDSFSKEKIKDNLPVREFIMLFLTYNYFVDTS